MVAKIATIQLRLTRLVNAKKKGKNFTNVKPLKKSKKDFFFPLKKNFPTIEVFS